MPIQLIATGTIIKDMRDPAAELKLRFATLRAWPQGADGAALRDLHALVFSHPDISEAELAQRLGWQREPLVQLAWSQTASEAPRLIGYKIGHLRKEGHYYSWIGGVDPAWRGQGIASRLMRDQHAWCQEQGYKTIRTHISNQWRNMLILNLRHGFDIIGTLTDEHGKPKLILEKRFETGAEFSAP